MTLQSTLTLLTLITIGSSAAGISAAEGSSNQPVNQLEFERLEKACQSKLPVLVIDTFPQADSGNLEGSPETSNVDESALLTNPKGRIVDIDGDGTSDLFHGELVELLVQQSGHTTKRLNLDGSLSLPELAEVLAPVVQSIESGKERYSRINFSQENPLKLAAFKNDLFPNDPTFPEITAANIRANSYRILEHLWTEREDLKVKELYELFGRLEKAGVPVVVAGGNFGPGFVNLFSMMPGVLTVGSMDHKSRKLLTSADNDYVRWWKTGVVVPEEVPDGMDLNGDQKPDVLTHKLSRGTPIVKLFNGKLAKSTVSSIAEDFIQWITRAAGIGGLVPNAALNVIDEGLYEVKHLVQLPTVTPGTVRLFTSLGTYALKRKDGPPRVFFEEKSDGTLLFDPKGTGSDKQRTRIPGTSFAAPIICVGV